MYDTIACTVIGVTEVHKYFAISITFIEIYTI